ncbi:MAG: conjugal transfer protein TrbL [Actinomycetia bacterium]|jgi:uncharacterized membrane protein|nr:conjugal transfer protein TrbL [Actinomycetes bacterium]MDQ1653457.1 hypothetical protein [Cryptosporangiaceae bacterium]MDQ1656361.1 hypothetical protein [Cryptosporangiaceae bacterium]
MHLFLLTLHVLAAVFLAGPLVIAPMTGLRALRAGDERGVRDSVRTSWLFGLLSLVIAGLGLLVVPTRPKEYGFGTPWVIISTTLYILVVAGVLLVLVPALRSAAKLLTPEPRIAVQPDTTAEPGPGDTATFASAADTSVLIPPSERDPEIRAKLDALRGRIAATSGIVSVLVLVIAVLMVTKPFGH